MQDTATARARYPANPSVAIDHLCRVLAQYELSAEEQFQVREVIGTLIDVENGVYNAQS